MVFTLPSKTRTVRGAKIRADGLLPAVVYGAHGEAISLSVDYSPFLKLYRAAGEASLVDLVIDGQNAGKVLIQEVQSDPVTDRPIHVDLRRIDMTKPMTATVEFRFVGEAPVIKASGGTMVTSISAVEVRCLPTDLVSTIEVDVSPLQSYDIVIKISDITLPPGMEILNRSSDMVVVKAMPALTEEQIKAMEAQGPTDISEIETVEKKKSAEEEAVAADAAPAEAVTAK